MFLFFVVLSLAFQVQAQDSVIIIRHGEKPAKGDNLTCKGLNRAIAIPRVLTSQFSVPLYTYVPQLTCDNATKHSRMFQTVLPLAARYNLTINSEFEKSKTKEVAKGIKSVLGEQQKTGTILVVWEHKNILPIATALGVADAQPWADDDYDSIWIITQPGTKMARLVKTKEGLNGVSDQCP